MIELGVEARYRRDLIAVVDAGQLEHGRCVVQIGAHQDRVGVRVLHNEAAAHDALLLENGGALLGAVGELGGLVAPGIGQAHANGAVGQLAQHDLSRGHGECGAAGAIRQRAIGGVRDGVTQRHHGAALKIAEPRKRGDATSRRHGERGVAVHLVDAAIGEKRGPVLHPRRGIAVLAHLFDIVIRAGANRALGDEIDGVFRGPWQHRHGQYFVAFVLARDAAEPAGDLLVRTKDEAAHDAVGAPRQDVGFGLALHREFLEPHRE